MKNRVVHFEIQADDVARAKKFYEDVFGWEVNHIMKEEESGIDYWGVKTGEDGTPGINGGLYKRLPKDEIYTYDCTIEVEDLDKAIEDVKRGGGKIISEKAEIPGVGWFAGAHDTEGNKFGMMQPTE